MTEVFDLFVAFIVVAAMSYGLLLLCDWVLDKALRCWRRFK